MTIGVVALLACLLFVLTGAVWLQCDKAATGVPVWPDMSGA